MKIADTRGKRAKLNIVVSLGTQLITILCGLIVPRLLLAHFGSEAYGATTSIAQFLAYITLLEGGIGGVTRAALYKPLAENNIEVISKIVGEIKRFFRIIGCIFIVYVLILACSFKTISNIECFDWFSTFLLVIVISISTFAQYFIGISYSVLIQAAQRQYITNTISILTTILNTILVVILVNIGANLIIVKLVSSCVFVLRPVLITLYVKRHYPLVKSDGKGTNYLSQKWSGLSQHIAFFLHSNTDVVLLTILGNLRLVAVYSVYNLVVSNIQNLTTSFSTGMEAMFGDMLAKNEMHELYRTFERFETLISLISSIMFSATAVLILPFVKIYTAGVTDANYIQPVFAIILTLASMAYCLRSPYHNLVIAAGHFKQTQYAAYGEAIINVGLSISLVIKFGLIGVAIGTLTAVIFRTIYYAIYLSKNIIKRKVSKFLKREGINALVFVCIYIAGSFAKSFFVMNNYFQWVIFAVVVVLMSALITLLLNYIFYKQYVQDIVVNQIKKFLRDRG